MARELLESYMEVERGTLGAIVALISPNMWENHPLVLMKLKVWHMAACLESRW